MEDTCFFHDGDVVDLAVVQTGVVRAGLRVEPGGVQRLTVTTVRTTCPDQILYCRPSERTFQPRILT